MSTLKDTLRSDLTAAIRAREQVVAATLRMALAALTTEEVAGPTPRRLGDDDVRRVLSTEAKKRREAAAAYEHAGRTELAARERDELAVLQRYLPARLTDEQLGALVAQAIADTGATAPGHLGQVMRTLQPQVAGRADGATVAAAVRAALTG
ncbi:MAG: GatB/YqeY domain-containing protein [Dermatophilaceae bacterium]